MSKVMLPAVAYGCKNMTSNTFTQGDNINHASHDNIKEILRSHL